ncbi:MAG: aminopeptidase P N-terminal domain-containing protein [Anaerolineae bacterium]
MYQMDFNPEELANRRKRVLDAIGSNALALIQGAEKPPAHDLFRQTNDFYYLSGVEVPHAYLLLDGRVQSCALFLPHQSPQRKEQEGEIFSAENAATVHRLTGIDAVYGIEELSKFLEGVKVLYTPLRMAEGAMMSWDTLRRSQQEITSDPWDGRPDRMRAFVALLRQRCPCAEIRDLCPISDDMRLVKSPKEIELLRKAGKLSAIGILEAMRATRPGIWEYQLDAVMRYTYLVNGARDAGYRAIIAGGPNIWYSHYCANSAQLAYGDLVLVDGAPDYHYYTSDIGRMWPINGRYTDVQRELYGFIVEYHKVYLELIRPGVTSEQIIGEAAERMRGVIERTIFSKSVYEKGARATLEFPYHMSHPVGMAVHDVSHYRGKVLQPGIVLSLDPSLWVPEECLYIRVEDTVLITETGIENLTADAPLDLDDVEQTMKQEGMLQRFPAL